MAINAIYKTTINELNTSNIISTKQQSIQKNKQTIQLKYRGQSYTRTAPEQNSHAENFDGQFRGTKMEITLPVQTHSKPSVHLMVYRGMTLGGEPSSFDFIASPLV